MGLYTGAFLGAVVNGDSMLPKTPELRPRVESPPPETAAGQLPIAKRVRQPASEEDVTALLQAWSLGDQAAFDRLVPLVYQELRRQARRQMAREQPGHTLQTTALVHEAYLRIANLPHLRWKNRVHFYAISAQLMRRVLVDCARARRNQKRGGATPKITFDDAKHLAGRHDTDLVALDDALTTLSAVDPRKCTVVEMKFFGGLAAGEIASVMHVSVETVQRDWKLAKLWLLRELSRQEAR
jgi:RNA polymerase sigma-70 factor, ECF subfamily